MAFWFDAVLGPLTISSSQELTLTLSPKTLVQLTGSGPFSIFGLAQTGGNLDGYVVTFMNISGGAITTFTFPHLSASASSAANKFRNPSGVGVAIGAQYGGVTYRYDLSISLWVCQGHSST